MKEKKKIEEILSQLTEEVKGEIISEKELQEAQKYAIKDYPRLVQLARAGLIPEPQLFKILYFLKDPKRFGVTPKVRNQLYDVMIKTLNYIVATDPAAWARFRAFLLKGEDETEELTEMKKSRKDILKEFKSVIAKEKHGLSSVRSLRASVELSEQLMLEAERHEPGTHWEASTGNSWGAKNKNGEVIYYNKSLYREAEALAKAFASGTESKATAVAKKKEMERTGKGVTKKREGQLFGTGGVKRTRGKSQGLSTKDVKQRDASAKGLDGPDSPKQALGSSVKKEKEVATRMFKIAEIVLEREKARKAGKDVGQDPNFNLCTVSIPGTNLFCDESLDIPRKSMPQLKTKVKPGSKAEEMLKKQLEEKGKPVTPESLKKEELNAEDAFLDHLKSKGVKVTTGEEMESVKMKATQNDLVGAKVLGMANSLMRPKEAGLSDEAAAKARKALTAPLIVSRDGYVLDGHHRWAAVAVTDLMQGKGNNPSKIKVIKVDMDIEDLVDESNVWGDELGLERKSANQQVSGEDKGTKKEAHEPSVGEILNESLTKTIGRILKEELAKYSMYA